ncbi:CATRA system-associated protein [Saccharothrix deserti]|uniref:CATRA system-associated protein n=1 Tax=Saccharothrix deserti TaxID=2593674 RepID=UPI00131C899C|nr:CATRA system-associated protein [Saccharothrix deserti]
MLNEELVEDVRMVLDDLVQWEMTERQWRHVAGLVGTLAAAVRACGADAVRDATDAVELAAPVRVTRVGQEPVVPPPPFVLERRSETLDSLRGAEDVEEDNDRSDTD